MQARTETIAAAKLRQLWEWMTTAREMDLIEQSYTGRGEAFFHVSGAGHEGAAVLNFFLGPQDWLHCHYRDKALMLARGVSPEAFFLALFTKDGSHSRGRQMNAHMSDPALKVLSIVGPVGNSALQAAGVAEAVRNAADRPIVVCALGDGMTQQGEVYEALAYSVKAQLPVLFFIEDNAFAISTQTQGRTFFDLPSGPASEYMGVPILRLDGRDPLACFGPMGDLTSAMRKDRAPRIVVFETDRLHSHTNADDHRVYRTAHEISSLAASGDPLNRLRYALLESGQSAEDLDRRAEEIRRELVEISVRAQASPEPQAVHDAMAPLPARVSPGIQEYRGKSAKDLPEDQRLTMLEAIRGVLEQRLAADPRVCLFGEDIEDPKGDVFGITKGLSSSYPERVLNSPLAEASILGVSVGRALTGDRPVAFLQFADFLPIAYNQIFAELGSMYWRTDGGWQAPVIVMITCGGYKPGLGPFHASSLEALAAHTPGVDVCMPSTAGDAAGMLNAAFESGRPTLFFYPKNCLNTRDAATSLDLADHLVPVGSARTLRAGTDISLVGYGNTVALCAKAADALEEVGVSAEVIDLRHIMPWDQDAVLASAQKTGRLLVTHEDNKSAGFGAEILATVAELSTDRIVMRRVTRGDTYVPCNFGNQLQVLPSYQRILETAVDMLGGSVSWVQDATASVGEYLIDAIGSSPSDEEVQVLEWLIKPGDRIVAGQKIAEMEADKAVFDFMSPVDGTVLEFLISEGDRIAVGKPIARVSLGDSSSTSGSAGPVEAVQGTGGGSAPADPIAARTPIKPITRENPGTPTISGISLQRKPALLAQRQSDTESGAKIAAGIIGVAAVSGSRTVDNEEISRLCPTWSPEDIVKRTGIESRNWIAEGEDGVELGYRAAKNLLEAQGLTIRDIDYIVCSTGTPMHHTPSTATMIQYRLASDLAQLAGTDADQILTPAVDLNAACSGYVFALQHVADYLASRPNERVLLLTSEVLSPQLDTSDPDTSPIFGDAATATLVGGRGLAEAWKLEVHSVSLAAQGEAGDILRVPSSPEKSIFMDGVKVFVRAVAMMMRMLRTACEHAGIALEKLDLIVPHQANQRIINAVRQRLKVPESKVFSNIAHLGNTSSSTIPLALADIMQELRAGQYLGLTAFGGGFTFGGAVLRAAE